MRRRVATVITTLAAISLGAAALAVAPAASALPGTTTKFPKGASTTRYTGKAFDTCTAPSLATMTAWAASPYRGIGVYIGGPMRGCAQPNLTPAWVTSVTTQGWKLLPIYMGLQAPCSGFTEPEKLITASKAAAQGTTSAADAVTEMKALGLQPGSAVYDDMEHYNADDTACRDAALTYLSSFTKELHRQGYVSGVYTAFTPGSADLSASYTSTSYARADAIWLARWDKAASATTGFTSIGTTQWNIHQRAKQYWHDVEETYPATGGVKLLIDNDYVDGPVATVARPHLISVKATPRSAPTTSSTASATLAVGTTVQVICQAPGKSSAGTKVWDKLSNGLYVNDHYVDTPSNTTYSGGIPRCNYAYQVTPAKGTAERSGAGSSYAKKGTRSAGALAWVVCQKSATKKTGTTKVWDQLNTGYYVSDYDVATASQTTYTAPVPRC